MMPIAKIREFVEEHGNKPEALASVVVVILILGIVIWKTMIPDTPRVGDYAVCTSDPFEYIVAFDGEFVLGPVEEDMDGLQPGWVRDNHGLYDVSVSVNDGDPQQFSFPPNRYVFRTGMQLKEGDKVAIRDRGSRVNTASARDDPYNFFIDGIVGAARHKLPRKNSKGYPSEGYPMMALFVGVEKEAALEQAPVK